MCWRLPGAPTGRNSSARPRPSKPVACHCVCSPLWLSVRCCETQFAGYLWLGCCVVGGPSLGRFSAAQNSSPIFRTGFVLLVFCSCFRLDCSGDFLIAHVTDTATNQSLAAIMGQLGEAVTSTRAAYGVQITRQQAVQVCVLLGNLRVCAVSVRLDVWFVCSAHSICRHFGYIAKTLS